MRKEKLEEIKYYFNELKTIQKEIINPKKDFLTKEVYKVYLNNGRIITREKLLKYNLDGSAVVIAPHIKETNEYLCVIEPRVFTSNSVALSFPAGYIEKNESYINASLRELEEETGYTSNDIILLDTIYQDEGISSALNRLVLAKDCLKKTNQHLDESEIIRYMTLYYEELLEAENLGYVTGSNTKLLLRDLKNRKE